MSPGYVYKGTQRGDADPWNAPKPEPKPPRIPRHTIPLQPCGTRAAHERHVRRGETPCEPCEKAKFEYGQQRYARYIARPEVKEARREYERKRYLRKKEGKG